MTSLRAWSLVTAGSGDQALRLIREQSFDLVLLDVMMPRVYAERPELRPQEPS